MKWILPIALFLSWQTSLAQDTLAIKNRVKSVGQEINSIKHKIDSILLKKGDSLKSVNKFDSLKNLNPTGKLQSKSDSIRNAVQSKLDKVEKKLSLAPVQSKIDSAGRQLSQKISETEKKIESEIDAGAEKVEDKINDANDVGEGLNTRIEEVNNKLKKIDPSTKGVNLKLPDGKTDIPKADLNLTEGGKAFDGLKIGNMSENLPKTDLNLPELKIDGSQQIQEVKDKLPDVNLSGKTDLLNKDVLNEAENKLQTISNSGKQIEEYSKELEKVKNKDFHEIETRELEQALVKRSGIEGLDTKTQELAKLKAQHEALLQKSRDTKLMKAELARKMKNVVNDQINIKSPAVKKTMDQVAKVKMVNSQVEDVKKLVKKRENELKELPPGERLLPGVAIQLYSNKVFSMDIAPQLGYRLSNRLNVGVGGVYRFSVDKSFTNYMQSAGVLGLRTYADFKMVKSFFAHGELETLRLQDKIIPLSESPSRHVVSSSFGVGTQFNFTSRIKATTFGLYRIEHSGHLPGATKLNLRMVFTLFAKRNSDTNGSD